MRPSTLSRLLAATMLILAAGASDLAAQRGAPATPREAPKVVRDGLEAFRTGGVEAGVRTLTSQWTDDDDKAKQDVLIDAFGRLGPSVGKVTGSDIALIHPISAHVQKVYVVLLFEQLPVYMALTVFQPADMEWRVVNVTFNTDMKAILPSWMIDPQPPK